MVARAPLVRPVEGAHRHPFMEAARGDGVVELAVGLCRRTSVPHPRRHVLRTARQGDADVALLQEAGNSPPDLAQPVQYGTDELWRERLYEGRPIYDRWSLVVQLSHRVEVEWFRAVPPISELGEHDIAISGIGTIAAARVTPRGRPADDGFIAVSMYARYIKPHPSTGTPWRVGAPDVSAHRILSDISAFIGHEDPSRHRILAAGDLNMIYGATGNTLALPACERAFWDRVAALGLEFLGPQAPHGWQPSAPQPDVPPDLDQHVPRRPLLEDIPAHDLDHSALPLDAVGGALCMARMVVARCPELAGV